MADVVSLHEAMSRMLARDLGVSVAFVEECSAHGIAPSSALALLGWFEGLPAREREVVRLAAERKRRRG